MATAPISPPLAVSAQLSAMSDPDGNDLVVIPRVIVEGRTRPGVLVLLDRGVDGSIEQRTRADAAGRYQFHVDLAVGVTPIAVAAQDLAAATTAVTVFVASRGDVILDFNLQVLQAIRNESTPPPVASRSLAMVQTAMYDAVASTDARLKPIYLTLRAPAGTSPVAAATQAAYDVAVSLFPKQKALFNPALLEGMNSVISAQARGFGIHMGDYAANAVLVARANDGSSATVPYTPGTQPGDWVPTPPAFAPALLPGWGLVKPFGLVSGSQFRPIAPPALNSAQYAASLQQVRDLGRATGSTRTADQTSIAKFWADGAGTFTPPGHWNQIAANAALSTKTDLATNARLFAVLNCALADAAIAAWDAKYTYNLWRPITAIQQTTTDTTWAPLLVTPPFPTYISGHSTFSGAAQVVLTGFFGPNFAFITQGDPSTKEAPRFFTSFEQAAQEAGISRIYGGIHFQFDNIPALYAGSQIGAWDLAHLAR